MLVWHACYVRSLDARGQRQMPTKKCYSLREGGRGVGGQGNAQFTGDSVNFDLNLQFSNFCQN